MLHAPERDELLPYGGDVEPAATQPEYPPFFGVGDGDIGAGELAAQARQLLLRFGRGTRGIDDARGLVLRLPLAGTAFRSLFDVGAIAGVLRGRKVGGDVDGTAAGGASLLALGAFDRRPGRLRALRHGDLEALALVEAGERFEQLFSDVTPGSAEHRDLLGDAKSTRRRGPCRCENALDA
ncbi:MAG: hypothetical protein HYS27_09660 [Deltaproteobacteria bacterium]|nr:hypothetical protein [Deltaproteobacteria bacterium]